ncbi:MAG: hypothetical protein ACOCV2_07135 [Persicimonas sp.]
MLCESKAILEETMRSVDASKLHIERIGDRAIVAPAYELEPIREALQEQGMYPKVVGNIVDPQILEQTDEEGEDDEDAEDDTESNESEESE